MTQKHIYWLQLICGIVLSISLFAAAVCLAGACLGIYRAGGDDPFTPQRVAAAFSAIAPVVYTSAGLCVGSAILHFFLPGEKKAPAAGSIGMQLQQQRSKKDLSACASEVEKLQRSRQLHRGITVFLLIFGSGAFLCYAFAPDRFTVENITTCVIRAVIALGICLVIPFIYGIFTAYFCRRSMKKELLLLKSAPCSETAPAAKKGGFPGIVTLRMGILAVALACLVYGYFAGGTADVLTKAVNICTECVGLG